MKLQTPVTAFTVMAFVSANHFLYYLKRVPLVGDLVPDGVYAAEGLKKAVAVLAAVLQTLLKLGFTAMYIIAAAALPAAVLAGSAGAPTFDSFAHIIIVLSLVVGSFLLPAAFEPKREKFLLVQLMHMDAKEYLSSTVLFRCLADFLCLLPLLAITSVLLGATVAQGVILAVLIGCARPVGEALNMYVYARTRRFLGRNSKALVLLGALGFAAAYVPVALGHPLPVVAVLLNPLAVVPFAAAALLSVRYILRYEKYPEIAIDTIKGMDFSVDPDKRLGEARFSNVKLREQDFSREELSSTKFDRKEGYAYLNALFYERHKRQLLNPVLVRLAAVAAVLVACVALSLVEPASVLDIGGHEGALLPFFVFIMYMMSTGERACRAMFYNCDLALLRYPFYRQRDAILRNFTVRLRMVAGLNLITAVAISVAVVTVTVLFQWNWPLTSYLFFAASILVLSLFFSVHHLFLYYVFQPYTADLGMKSPFFTVINTAVYFLCFLSLQIGTAPSYFTLVVIASTAAYIAAALFLVHRFAPITFRVK